MSGVPYLAMWLVSIAGSIIVDTIIEKKILPTTVIRKIANTIATMGPALALLGKRRQCEGVTVKLLLRCLLHWGPAHHSHAAPHRGRGLQWVYLLGVGEGFKKKRLEFSTLGLTQVDFILFLASEPLFPFRLTTSVCDRLLTKGAERHAGHRKQLCRDSHGSDQCAG